MSGDAGSSKSLFRTLEQFIFKEVLGVDVARKVLFEAFLFILAIFLHLEHSVDKKPAVLICDKSPFTEEESHISEWLKNTKLSHLTTNDVYGNYEAFMPEKFNGVKSTFIYPASVHHIEKYRRQNVVVIYETPEDYQNITETFIQQKNFDLSWVYNFLDKKAEVDRIIAEDDHPCNGFILGMDAKWAGVDVGNLYLQAIVRRRDLRSVRDLTANELPLLENIRDKSLAVIKEKYDLDKKDVLMYFHYQPTYYHLHVHFINIKYEAPGLRSTSIMLESVINNLFKYPTYYKDATLPFISNENHPLFSMFKKAGRV